MTNIPRTQAQTQDQEEQEPNTLLHEDEVFKDGFTQVSNRVLRARNLSAPAKTLYAILLSYSWQADKCFPGYTRLCEDMQLSEKIVRKYMQELEGVKLLAQKRRGLGLTNIYILLSLKNATLDTASGAERDTCPVQERDRGTDPERDTCPDKEYSSKNTKINKTKILRKADALKLELGGEGGETPARSHIPRGTIRNRLEHTSREETQGLNSHRDRSHVTNTTPTRGGTPTQKRVAKIEAEKTKLRPTLKPMTQEEIDEKRRSGQNASGLTPLASIIPASHWQELEARAAATTHENGHRTGAQNSNGLHYNTATKHAPDFIDALMEQFSKVLHDEVENIPQNINRVAKLYRQLEASEEDFIRIMHDAYTAAKRKQNITTMHSDGRPNKMRYFFSVLEDKARLR